ncbi:hypothetical protein AMTR_s00107p00103500 [Amborella trichopoda]|uniref:DUF659 domain-containing protein n=1 Tax=Amborella trichopoda TaxID=13333 RepID=W1P032_AMBTC|nr:hypothetical protein AMTR_s00107p00103500 [Amborella trichopoda]
MGSKLMKRRNHLIRTPCTAHCINLVLDEIGELKNVKETLASIKSITKFIYNHSKILNLMREYTGRELIRHAITRFATDYLAMNSIVQSDAELRRMFTSEAWTKDKLAKSCEGRIVDGIISDKMF